MNGVVAVWCHDARHAAEPVLIDTFRRTSDSYNGRQWVGDDEQVTTHGAATERYRSTRSARIDDASGEYYMVHRLHCDRCPKTKSVPARRERFWSALDAIDLRHDDETIELRLLAAIVSKQ